MLRKIFSIFILFTIPYFSLAAPADDLQQKLQNFQSMTAKFQQTVRSNDGTLLQQASGNMAILRPGKFRWNTTAPLSQLIVTDGKTLWIYEADLQQVTIRHLNDSNIGEIPILLLTSNNIDIAKSFNVQALTSAGNSYQLVPKQTDSLIGKIVLTFNNNIIVSMRLISQLGQNTTINFTDVKLNTAINAAQFNFKPPAGVDIVNDTN